MATHTFTQSRKLSPGRASFEAAVHRLLTWEMHRGAGLQVEPNLPVAAAGQTFTVNVSLKHSRIGLKAPVRIVEVIDENSTSSYRRGFTYETMPGHPERGRESFIVKLDYATQSVGFVISATSKPGRWWVALGGPIARAAQAYVTRRYLAAIS